jgi:hypothetical protein
MFAARILFRMRAMVKSIASLTLALAALAAAPAAAGAGTYALVGLGPKAGVGGDLDDAVDGDSRTLRFGLGQRIDPVALEASIFGADLVGTGNGFAAGREFATLSLGLDLKAFFSLLGPIELFGKVGLNQTWIMGNDYEGAGWDVGGGAQFTLDLPLGYAAVWVELTHQSLSLSVDGRPDRDGSLNMLMIGGSLGI